MPAPLPPLWRRIYDTIEKPLGDALAAGARSSTFGDVMAISVKVPRRVQREVERRTRHVLHFANLPTATDVRQLTSQVTDLQREVRSLSREANEPRPRTTKSASTARPATRPAPKTRADG